MKAREFVFEYNRNATIKNHGEKLLQRAEDDPTAPDGDVTSLLAEIEAADPSPQKMYVQWIARRYIAGDIGRWEDMSSNIRPALVQFAELKRTNKLEPEHADIGKIKNIEDVIDFYHERVKTDIAKVKADGLKWIIKKPDFHVFITLTHKANQLVGSEAHWCTAKESPKNFNDYTEKGPLYVITLNPGTNESKFQYHYESGQVMDKRNEPISQNDTALLSKNKNWADFLNMQIKEHYTQYFNKQ